MLLRHARRWWPLVVLRRASALAANEQWTKVDVGGKTAKLFLKDARGELSKEAWMAEYVKRRLSFKGDVTKGEALEKPWPAIVRDVDTDGNDVAWPPAQVDGVRSYECDYLDHPSQDSVPDDRLLAFEGEGYARVAKSSEWEIKAKNWDAAHTSACLLYTSPSPRDATLSRMPSSA